MLAVIAAVLFALAFIINAGHVSTDVVFSPFSLAMVGLALLAFHLTGKGPPLAKVRRRRR
jgi:drug/metabolite transporter (DMT)-like permease